MRIGKKTNHSTRTTVVERQAPGVSVVILALGLVPLLTPVLVLGYAYLKYHTLAHIENTLYPMYAVPVLAGIFLLVLLQRKIKQMACVTEAIKVAAEGQAAPAELFVAEGDAGPGKQWNEIVRQYLSGIGEQDAISVTTLADSTGHERVLLEILMQAVIGVDRSGRILIANTAATNFLGKPIEQLIGSSLDEVLDANANQSVTDVLQGRVQRRNSTDFTRGGGELLHLTVTPVRADGRLCAVVTIEDVTRQRLAEKSRHEFLAQATHELRTPLTNIRLYVEEAIDAGDSDPSTRAEALNVISHESLRLERLVSELLDISELEAGARVMDKGDVRVEQLMEQLQADYVALAESKNITLEFDLPPKIPVLQGDRAKIAGALHNLLGNAIKYTPNGGTVTVLVDETEGMLRIAITDTGFGISPEEQTRVYEKFFRSSDQRVAEVEGTGLGLAFAKQVAEMHGGELSLESELNQGSTFTMGLPKPRIAA